jgi:hypothetical protein
MSAAEAVVPSTADLRDLRRIPGVGVSIARDLWELGYQRVADLAGANPEAMFTRLCEQQGMQIDRCLRYTLRCAVYFASEAEHDPALLKWWAWKDRA